MPWLIISMAKSTSRIEFLATMPNSIRMPISTGSETGLPVRCKRNHRAQRRQQQRTHVDERRQEPAVEQHQHREHQQHAGHQRDGEVIEQLGLPLLVAQLAAG